MTGPFGPNWRRACEPNATLARAQPRPSRSPPNWLKCKESVRRVDQARSLLPVGVHSARHEHLRTAGRGLAFFSPLVTMIPRALEPEVMDSPDEARDYDAMDHA